MALYVLLGIQALELALIAGLLLGAAPERRRPRPRYSMAWRREADPEPEDGRMRQLEEDWNRGVESLLGYDLTAARRARERQEQ